MEIRNDDTVRESAGEQRQGRILHIYRSFLFLHNRQMHENSGIFVVRNTSIVSVAAGQGRTNAGVDMSKIVSTNGRNGAPSAIPPPPKTLGRDRLIGKTCTVRKGMYKGLLGIIKDTTETDARVELHTKNRVINIPKALLNIKDSATGQTIDMSRFGGSRPGATPGHPGGVGGATPRMPSYDGSRTPAFNGGQTPGWGAGAAAAALAAGNRTPGWGMTNSNIKTPGWKQQIGARTPAVPRNDGSRTTYGDGGRTPYGGATSYGGVSDITPEHDFHCVS